jgi:hypothetical protein
MQKIIDKIRNEPIVSRVGLAAVLNVLVVAGVIDPDVSTEIEVAVLSAVNVILILAGRAKVTPVAKA